MTVKSNKDNKEVVKEKPASTASKKKISLIVFKTLKDMTNITYNGFKASLGVEDGAEFTQTVLEKKFKEYEAKKAFVKK